jgi:hypothetical protein
MLNKDICWKCYLDMWNNHYPDGTRYITGTFVKTFTQSFDAGYCPLHSPWLVVVKDEPPDKCKYLLEQTVSKI